MAQLSARLSKLEQYSGYPEAVGVQFPNEPVRVAGDNEEMTEEVFRQRYSGSYLIRMRYIAKATDPPGVSLKTTL